VASIDARDDGYRVRWRYRGRARSHTCPDLKTARRVRSEIERCLALGEDWEPRSRSGAVPALTGEDGLFASWLRDQERLVSDSSLRRKAIACRRFALFLRARWPRGALTVDYLSRDVLAEWHLQLLGDDLAEHTASVYVQDVAQAWAWGHDSDLFGADTPRPRLPQMPKVMPRQARPAPTWAEMDAVVEASRNHGNGPTYYRIALIQRYTALRSGQAHRLRGSDFDLARDRLRIRGELGKSNGERRGRDLPLHPALKAEVATWGRLDDSPICGDLGYIQYVTLQAILKEAGMLGPDEERLPQWAGPTHAFRHGVITGLGLAGVPTHLVAYLAGHTQSVTLEVYTDFGAMWAGLTDAVSRIPIVGDSGSVASLDAVRGSVRSVSRPGGASGTSP
jgi:integrase